MSVPAKLEWFVSARFGLFVHYGLYSMLGRGEWVLNREGIPIPEYKALADRFNPSKFDANAICDLALEAGMKYVNLTTMHHDGFRLYDTELSDFNSMRACGRDLVREFIDAAKARGLKVALYHSLNNWIDRPDGVAALESKDAYDEFIAATHERIRELVTLFNPIDILWYDGWWPFHAKGWQSEKMNAMVSSIQPGILFNGRNALPGDFATPEGHLTAPDPWRPWEGCLTFNNHWGYHRNDNEWKSPQEIIGLLCRAANGKGNLLFNIGPKGDGSVPEDSVRILREIGKWLEINGEAVFETDQFTFNYEKRLPHHRSDWGNQGPFTGKGNVFYQVLRYWPGTGNTVAGIVGNVQSVELLGGGKLPFKQNGPVVTVTNLPENPPRLCPVLKYTIDRKSEIYWTGGMRVPNVPHPPYDPAPSDIGD